MFSQNTYVKAKASAAVFRQVSKSSVLRAYWRVKTSNISGAPATMERVRSPAPIKAPVSSKSPDLVQMRHLEDGRAAHASHVFNAFSQYARYRLVMQVIALHCINRFSVRSCKLCSRTHFAIGSVVSCFTRSLIAL
ncbi:hypothetical protein EVAR_49463_1 [Eumeta japonica]|uniref:Uncharacterized protein n=1 Tax=Eumeta variegata TaxID=151549 RepID=A0A4C1Y3E9_EUMVA|nr:hypothetical protein EVAR_49463_1 [Eumeta japonica]